MSDGVVVTVNWLVKAKCLDETIAMLRMFFIETQRRVGFRKIQLLRNSTEENSIILLEEWDTVEDFQSYIKFRTESGDLSNLMQMADTSPQINIWNKHPLAQA